jgi:serine/threonine protein kinase
MAPEIFNNIGYSYPADIWALGVILYKLLVGCFPFKGIFINIVF